MRPGTDFVHAIKHANEYALPLAVVKVLPLQRPENHAQLRAGLLQLEQELQVNNIPLMLMITEQTRADIALSRLSPLIVHQATHGAANDLHGARTAWTPAIMSAEDVLHYAEEVWSGQRVSCL